MAQETYEANNGKYAARVEVGQPVGAFYGYSLFRCIQR